jgi:PKD domain
MHGRLALALLALPLLLPATANAAVAPGLDIRKVEAFTSSAGALVRVTLRAPLDGRISVRFQRRDGTRGTSRRSAVIRGRRRIDFLFAGDARNLARVIVRTGGDRAALRLPRNADDCAALARLARRLRPLRRGRPAVTRRLRAISRRRAGCGDPVLPITPAPPPASAPAPVFTAPSAGFALAHGLTPEDPLSAGTDLTFSDASQGTDLVDWTWDFGDGTTASGRIVHHTYAQPGRYTVLLTVRNARGQVNAFGREVFVRAPGSATFNGGAVPCPGPGETIPVTVRLRVPSWARLPAQVSYSIAAGPCGADASGARDLTITPGNDGDHKDAWGRDESTLEFTFDLSDGTGSGTVDPVVTASWS